MSIQGRKQPYYTALMESSKQPKEPTKRATRRTKRATRRAKIPPSTVYIEMSHKNMYVISRKLADRMRKLFSGWKTKECRFGTRCRLGPFCRYLHPCERIGVDPSIVVTNRTVVHITAHDADTKYVVSCEIASAMRRMIRKWKTQHCHFDCSHDECAHDYGHCHEKFCDYGLFCLRKHKCVVCE